METRKASLTPVWRGGLARCATAWLRNRFRRGRRGGSLAAGAPAIYGVCGALFTLSVEAASPPRPFTVVAFGTSLTARGGWQDPLQAALSGCAGRDVDVRTVARSGASSRWALTMTSEVAALRPDVVLVEFAANDAAFNRLLPPSWSEANLREIIRRLREAAPQARIVLMTMNPTLGLRFAIRPFLDSYYDIHVRVAADLGLTLVENRPGWRALTPRELADALPDGSHPTPEVASRIIVPNVRAALFPDCAP